MRPLGERLGYVAALVESRDQGVLEFVTSTPAASRGLIAALEEGAVVKWEIAQLLEAAGEDALREAGAPDDVVTMVASWRTAREASVQRTGVRRDARNPKPARISATCSGYRWRSGERSSFVGRVSTGPRLASSTEPEIEILRETLDEWWGDARSSSCRAGHGAVRQHRQLGSRRAQLRAGHQLRAVRRALGSGGHVRIPVRAAVQVAHRAGARRTGSTARPPKPLGICAF